ncbi:MAG: DUF1853 family protein [Gammaproteobacteria bacterium]|nr:DUF1853 family protein [Gammaproteobacteria bacterium]
MTAADADLLTTLYDPLVRDLAWALFSASLLATEPDADDWPKHAESIARLQSLDREPTALHKAVMAQRSGRLGLYFEALWQFWLTDNADYALRAHNLQIQVDGTTSGELDLIVEHRRSGQLQHWELAVKFYLGMGDTTEMSAWIGPNAQDRFDRKLQHLHDHQLPLLQYPETQSQLTASGWNIRQQRLILKGRLFYPLLETTPAPAGAAPDHLRGWWARPEEFMAHFGSTSLQWQVLGREDWLAPLRRAAAGNLQTAAEIFLALDNLSQRPQCVAGFANGDECSRGFIVPAGWPGH